LLDILQAAKFILSFVAGKPKEEFLEDVQCQDAVIRRLEIIGEASRRISPQGRKELPNVPWEDMIGMRNKLIHEYGDVDLDVVWDSTQFDLPPLVKALERIVPSGQEM
jgi:uncharacterized protein with HEPN domain